MKHQGSTLEELEALPEWTGWSEGMRVIDGKTVKVRIRRQLGAQWFEENESPGFTDANGETWRLVTVEGQRYRARA